MFTKSFTSLVFSSRSLHILGLNAKRDAVTKFASLDIPAGVIVNYRVQNQGTLTAIIAKAWKDLKITNKSVGIVIPEFSTYTKSIKMPKLAVKDLDEAVRWQSQEFLPSQAQEMVMDWQIVKETESEVDILAVAVPKDVLTGYVEVVSQAGLQPLVVETPALSLARMAGHDDTAKLGIYLSEDETILVLSMGKNILASSVASVTSQREIIQTAVRLISHFSGTEIKKVLLGGASLSQEFMKELADNLSLPVEIFDKKIQGLNPQQIHQYLIAISLQDKDPSVPESEFTINLLPQVWAKHYKTILRDFRLWTLTLTFSIVTWSCFLGAFVMYMLLNIQVSSAKEKVVEVASSEVTKAFDDIKEVNTLSSKVLTLSQMKKPYRQIINTIASAKPSGVHITHYKLNLENGDILIEGKADDRDALISFKQAIESKEGFSGVSLPISSFRQERDLDFSMTLSFEKSAKKGPPPKLKV